LRYYNYSFLLYVIVSAFLVGFYVFVYCVKVPVNRVPRLEAILKSDPVVEECARRRFSTLKPMPTLAEAVAARPPRRREQYVLVAASGGRPPKHVKADAAEELERGALRLRLLAALK